MNRIFAIGSRVVFIFCVVPHPLENDSTNLSSTSTFVPVLHDFYED
jgi:hypothetical protein